MSSVKIDLIDTKNELLDMDDQIDLIDKKIDETHFTHFIPKLFSL